MDYYKILSINKLSNHEDIERSYQEKLVKLNQAYNVLSDPLSKKQYDEKMNSSLLSTNNFENVLNNINHHFSDSLFSEISNQSKLPPNDYTYQKSYSYQSEYDSSKGINRVKKSYY